MAIGVTVDFEGATLAQYDAAIANAGMAPGGQGGPGCLFHWVAQTPGGFRVTDVWETREQFEAFAASHIMPSVAAAGLTAPPRIEFSEVHNHFTPGPSAGETVVRRFFEELCNGRRMELARELVTEDYVSHGPQAPPANGPDEVVARVGLYQEALDGHWTVEELSSVGDRVVARWTGTGTHVGELMGIPATGRPIAVDAITIFRIADDGRIAEEWTVWDALGLLQQIGVVPEPAAA
jgi:steroid delta-isomerase-like uncharacterized protein